MNKQTRSVMEDDLRVREEYHQREARYILTNDQFSRREKIAASLQHEFRVAFGLGVKTERAMAKKRAKKGTSK